MNVCRRCGNDAPVLAALGGEIPLPYCGACSAELAAAADAEEREKSIERALVRAGMTRRLAGYSLRSHPSDEAATAGDAWADAYVTGTRRRNFWISGPVGRGKTGLAWGIVRLLTVRSIDQFWALPEGERENEPAPPALFLGWADLLADLKATFDVERRGDVADPSAILDRASRVPVLALDDLGRERPTAYAVEQLSNLVEDRYQRLLPTIVTSNYSTRELASRLGSETSAIDGERIVSRLLEGAIDYVFKSESLRRKEQT